MKQKSIRTKLSHILLEDTLPLVISEKLTHKIKFLCEKIKHIEWSGILFYRIEGSIQDPENCTLIAEDLYLMDKGSTSYTEYEFTGEVIGYLIDNNLHDHKMGHIHSHHTMSTFFSGTDTSELEDNSENHNFYLSLIVNNAMENMAKVAFRGNIVSPEPVQYIAKDEDGQDYIFNPIKQLEEQVLFIYNTEIIYAKENTHIDKQFIDRFEEINTVSANKLQTMSNRYSKAVTIVQKDFEFEETDYIAKTFEESLTPLFPLNLEEELSNLEPEEKDFLKVLIGGPSRDSDVFTLEEVIKEIDKNPSKRYTLNNEDCTTSFYKIADRKISGKEDIEKARILYEISWGLYCFLNEIVVEYPYYQNICDNLIDIHNTLEEKLKIYAN